MPCAAARPLWPSSLAPGRSSFALVPSASAGPSPPVVPPGLPVCCSGFSLASVQSADLVCDGSQVAHPDPDLGGGVAWPFSNWEQCLGPREAVSPQWSPRRPRFLSFRMSQCGTRAVVLEGLDCIVSRLALWVGFRGDTFSLFAIPLIMEVISRIIDTARENRQFLFQFSSQMKLYLS